MMVFAPRVKALAPARGNLAAYVKRPAHGVHHCGRYLLNVPRDTERLRACRPSALRRYQQALRYPGHAPVRLPPWSTTARKPPQTAVRASVCYAGFDASWSTPNSSCSDPPAIQSNVARSPRPTWPKPNCDFITTFRLDMLPQKCQICATLRRCGWHANLNRRC